MSDYISRVDAADGAATYLPHRLPYAAFGKRSMDILLALAILPIVGPLILLICAFVSLDGGPGVFGHRRIGRNGAEFKCWKIRSMVVDAEAKLVEFLASDDDAAAEWEASRKLTDDPRITRFGHFLRATSLDELPQIFNVLRGEMSFVGPRPVIRDELPLYESQVGVYLAQKPGITGLWQVSGRNDVSYAERVRLDADYQASCSFRTDVGIIMRTAHAVVKRTGK